MNRTLRKNGFACHVQIETLQSVQSLFGYLEDDSIRSVAKSLLVPLSQAYGVVIHYHQFSHKPAGQRALHDRKRPEFPCDFDSPEEVTDVNGRRSWRPGPFLCCASLCAGSVPEPPSVFPSLNRTQNQTAARCATRVPFFWCALQGALTWR